MFRCFYGSCSGKSATGTFPYIDRNCFNSVAVWQVRLRTAISVYFAFIVTFTVWDIAHRRTPCVDAGLYCVAWSVSVVRTGERRLNGRTDRGPVGGQTGVSSRDLALERADLTTERGTFEGDICLPILAYFPGSVLRIVCLPNARGGCMLQLSP